MFTCPNRIVVIQINTSDGQRNDNFDLLINGINVGPCIMEQDETQATLFIGSLDEGFSLSQSDFPQPNIDSLEAIIRFDGSILNDGANTFELINTQVNSNQNEIVVRVRIYEATGSMTAMPTVVSDTFISGLDGVNFSGGFALTCPAFQTMFLCPNRIAVIQITKTLGLTEDSFDVFVNKQFIGTCLVNATENFGNVFIGSENPNLKIDEDEFPYPVELYQRIRFSELILNGGRNLIELQNVDQEGDTVGIEVDVRLYEIKNSKLVGPVVVKDIYFDQVTAENFANGNLSDEFELTCPIPEGLSPLYEFDPSFPVDTGNLNQVFSGSGAHNKKDVTFSFDMLDQQANLIQSNQQFIENPLVESVTFDILDTGGNLISENYFSGKFARSITISELDNERIFGRYTKDFGVRIKVPNSFDGSTFTGEFYAYGNVPNIIAAIPSNDGEVNFYGAPEVTDSLTVRVSLQNSLNYVKINRYDIYAFTEEGVVLPALTELDPSAQSGFLYSQNTNVLDDVYNLTINPVGLGFDTPYYFTIVPYSDLGSGRPFSFGPSIFVAEENSDELAALQGIELRLFDGDAFSLNKFKSGSITDDSFGLLDTVSGTSFSTAKYLIEITDTTGLKISSELKMVINPDDIFLIEEPINNTGQVDYFVEQAGSNFELYASGITGTGFYKLHKTLI